MSARFLYCKNGASIKVTDTLVRLDDVLEIIDKMPNANPSYWNKCDVVDREGIREEILALKGGDKE